MELPGTDRFAILSRLGEGGLGVVYEAFDRQRKRRVALKTLRRTAPETVARLKHEFRSLQDLRHPNLVTLYELHEQQGAWFFTMELVSGVDFLLHVAEESPPGFHEQRLLEALRQLTIGLCALHQAGKVHRDIKPGNVLVSRSGRLVLLDFGLVVDSTRPTGDEEQGLAGTVEYMAPEQTLGDPVGTPADWYGVGVMLYEALTGRLPFVGKPFAVLLDKQQREPEPPHRIAENVPPDLGALCVELLRTDASRRPDGPEILERLSAASPATAGPRLHPAPHDAFVGRRQELSALRQALGDARRGRPCSLLVLGDAGVGKSTLVQRFVDELPADVLVCRGRCYQHESVPYKGVDGLVDGLVRITRAREDPLLQPAEAWLLGRIFPAVRGLVPRGAAPHLARPMDPLRLRHEAVEVLRAWLSRLARQAPTLLLLEDLHWGGADTWSVLSQLLQPPDPPRLLTVATARLGGDSLRDATGTIDQLPGECRPLLLTRFGQEEALVAARTLLGDADDALAQELAHRSGGHPLELLNLARHALVFGSADSDAPSALAARITRLDPAGQRLLQLLALSDEPLPIAAVAVAGELSTEDLEQQLTTLQLEHLIRLATDRVADHVEPYHDLIRQAVRGEIPAEQRRLVHRRLALALQQLGGVDAGLLAAHWHGAGESRVAADYALQAALEADAALAFDHAARLYGVALRALDAEDPERRRTQIRLGHALANAGRGADAADAFLGAAEGTDGLEALDLRRHAAEQLLCSGHVDRGLALLEQTLGTVGVKVPHRPLKAMAATALRWTRLGLRGYEHRHDIEPDPALLARIDACWSATVGLGMVDLIRAMYFQALHTGFALRSGDPYRMLRALAMEAPFHAARGQRGERRTAQLVAMVDDLAQQTEHPQGRGLAAACVGLAAMQQGNWLGAEQRLSQAVEIFRTSALGTAWELTTSQISLLWARAALGQLGELARRVPALLHDARERGDLYASTSVAVGLPNLAWLTVDDPTAALEAASVGMHRWSRDGTHIQHVFYAQAVANVDLYCGNPVAAFRRVTDFWPRLARSRLLFNQLIRIVMLDLRARAALAVAASGEATPRLLTRVRSDVARLERQGRPWAHGLATLLRAGLAEVGGDPHAARRPLERAAATFDDAGMALHAAAARRRLGQLLGGHAGAELSSRAARYMEQQGVRAPSRMTALLLPWGDR